MQSNIVEKTAKYFREKGVVLPTISELKNPHSISEDIKNKVLKLDKDAMDPANLFRVHWFNKRDHSKFLDVPEHIVLPSEFTGVDAKIIVNLGRYFPLITAHKVLAAYGCLLPRILNGSFDYTKHKAVWPSTGNYCRGGVAISKILGFKSVAILPEGMSKERFDWLEKWVEDKNDIIKTTGTESNVKEIYDACNVLEKDKNNDIINQFDEYYNYATHRAITGASFEKSFLKVKGDSDLQARFYVSASGSSGTLAAGDYLKENLNAQIAVVEAPECPTLLYNGYGEHNIQGIGDKHVPLIHNVMNSDYVVGVSDEATNNLNLLFNTDEGKNYLTNRKGFKSDFVDRLPEFGFSSIAIQPSKSLNQRRLMAMRAAKLDAYRSLTEQIHGIYIQGETTVGEAVLTSDKLGAALRGTVMGARTVKIEPTGSDTYQVELSVSQTHIDRLLKSYRRGLL